MFASYQVSIPQSCEQCLSYIWLMDKALLCSGECPSSPAPLCPVTGQLPVFLERHPQHVSPT